MKGRETSYLSVLDSFFDLRMLSQLIFSKLLQRPLANAKIAQYYTYTVSLAHKQLPVR